MTIGNNIRELSLDWYLPKSDFEKKHLKDKYYPNIPIGFDSHWGFHFTFGQIEEMFLKESSEILSKPLTK